MSKQTINIGASPNDGTGTPLRTSFDYCNQNFTELYTATGPSGNNIVVPGTATITGAATVGTTLGVTGNLSAAANSILGTGSKSTDTLLDFSADTGTQRIYLDRGGRNLIFKDVTTNIENYRITGVTGVQTWGVGGTTAMTLNSTGLGIGVASASIAARLHVKGAASQNPLILDTLGYNQIVLQVSGANRGQIFADATNCFAVVDAANANTRFVVTDTGNVGIGNTPSATDSTYFQALELARVGQGLTCVKTAFTSTPNSWLSNNSYATYSAGTVWKYAVSSQLAAQYRLAGGEHQWLNAPNSGVSGAGTTAVFTQAMTLDASGQLGVGTTTPDIFARFYTRSIGFNSTGSTMLQINGTSYGGVDLGAAGVRTFSLTSSATDANISTVTNIPLIFNINNSEAMRLNSTSNLVLKGGTAAANGVGVTFPATQVASSDANCLDDYEEGTWTIGLEFGGASTGMTTNANTGKYTKIGRQVTVTGYLSLTSKGSSTGDALITGLPFLINSYGGLSIYLAQITFADFPMGYSNNGTSTIPLRECTNAGVSSTLTNSDFANNSEIIFTMTYNVA